MSEFDLNFIRIFVYALLPPTFYNWWVTSSRIPRMTHQFSISNKIHIYEHADKLKIDQVIANALHAIRETRQRIKKELTVEA